MTARAAMFTTSVTAKRTRPAAVSALTARPEDSGKSSAKCAAIVDGLPEPEHGARDEHGAAGGRRRSLEERDEPEIVREPVEQPDRGRAEDRDAAVNDP